MKFKKTLKKFLRILVPLFSVKLCLFWAYALWNQCILYEPKTLVAKSEAIGLIIFSTLAFILFLMELSEDE